MYLHRSWEERNSHFPQNTAYTSANTAQYELSCHSHSWDQQDPYPQSNTLAGWLQFVLKTVGRSYPGARLCIHVCNISWSSFWAISSVLLGPWVTSNISATPPSLVSPRDSLGARYILLSILLMSSTFVNPHWLFTVAVFPFTCSEMACIKTCYLIFPRIEERVTIF